VILGGGVAVCCLFTFVGASRGNLTIVQLSCFFLYARLSVCLFVSLSVFPLIYLENYTAERNQIFFAFCLRPWLSPLLSTHV